MAHTVQLLRHDTYCLQFPINVEITTADSQSGLRILLLLRLIN